MLTPLTCIKVADLPREGAAAKREAAYRRRMELAQGLEARGLLDNLDAHDGKVVFTVGNRAGFAAKEHAARC